MRRASLLLLALVPLTGAAQIILPPLPAKQRAELEACIKAEGGDARALQVCTQRMDEASRRGQAPPAPASTVAPAPVTVPPAVQPAAPAPPTQPAPVPEGLPAPPPASAAEPTQAELDYEAIYGTEEYNPVADSTLPQPAELPVSYDP
jgi:phospholipid-binding lipoprotein MlaA